MSALRALGLLALLVAACDAEPPVVSVDAGANLCDDPGATCATCSAADCLTTARAECQRAALVPAVMFCASCHGQANAR